MALGTAAPPPPPEIPLISLLHSTPQDILAALSHVGFIHLALEGTPLTQDAVDKAFDLSAALHAAPAAERAALPTDDEHGNGYVGMRGSLDERVRSGKADLKEAFMWGRYDSGKGEVEGVQALPASVEGRRGELIEFGAMCFETSLRLLDMLSVAFELPRDFFRRTHKDSGNNGMSFLNYPALEKPAESDDIRAGSHKDWGDITLLFQEQNGQPGLQVYLPRPEATPPQKGMQLVQGDVDLESGTWISAPIVPGTVLVNVGLTLEAMTDGLCKANVHRVVFPAPVPGGELPSTRRSIAYFSTPSSDVVMNPVRPGGVIVETEGASTVRDFMRERRRLAGVL